MTQVTLKQRIISFLDSGKGQNIIVCLILLAFLGISIMSVRGRGVTTDEPHHYRYGVNVLNGNPERFDDSKMPFSAWNALPAQISTVIPLSDGYLKRQLSEFVTARMMTTIFSMIVALMVFFWSRKLYGFVPGLISLILYVLDPNIIAHSQLVTTDVYVTGMVLFSFYGLWKFANGRTWANCLFVSAILGAAQLAKYTAISLYPLSILTLLIHDSPSLVNAYKRSDWRLLGFTLLDYVRYIFVATIIGLIFVNVGFLFSRTFTPFNDYAFRSTVFNALQSKLSFVVPVPYPYLEGLDWMVNTENTGNLSGNVYLLGQLSSLNGFPGYYFVASLLKVPISIQVILFSSIIHYFFWNRRRNNFFRDEAFLLAPVIFFVVYFNFFFNTQIGIRYFLIVFPLLYVFSGNLFVEWQNFSLKKRLTIFALGVYLLVSVLSYYPFYISYFNEIVWDRKTAYRYLADSNLDWGQDEPVLRDYIAEHPGVRKAPEKPMLLKRTARYYVPASQLVGVTRDPGTYEWLRENFEPVDMIAPSYPLFEITPEQMKDMCERTTYCE